MTLDHGDILLTIAHPHGDVEVTLARWIEIGPGPRPLVQPIKACRVSTGEPLPLRVIPFRYRNSGWSRFLMRLGLLADPWKPTRA
jgi:hypothetical protein